MPYYQWIGVTIDGNKKKGTQAALSDEALTEILLNAHIAPLKITKKTVLFKRKPSSKIRAQLYEQLLLLLQAGIRFPKAISITATHYNEYPLLQEFLYDAAIEMEKGLSWDSCIKKSNLFSELEENLFKMGQEANHLIATIQFVAHFLIQKAHYKEKLRSALTMPIIIAMITVSLFIGIIIFVIPQFATFLQTNNQQLDPTIVTLMTIRSWITSPFSIIVFGIGLLSGVYIFRHINRIKKINAYLGILKKHIPLYRSISRYSFLVSFFHTLHLMLESGNTIEQSLSLITISTSNQEKKDLINTLFEQVTIGKPLSDALKEHSDLFEIDDIFLIHAGELSGSTDQAAKSLYEKYSKKLDSLMLAIHNYAQPTAIIILGLFIGLMVVGIYKPILSIALGI